MIQQFVYQYEGLLKPRVCAGLQHQFLHPRIRHVVADGDLGGDDGALAVQHMDRVGDQQHIGQGGQVAPLGLDLGVDQGASGHAAELIVHPDVVAGSKGLGSLQHETCHGVGHEGGGGQGDHRGQHYPQQAEDLAPGLFADGQQDHEGDDRHEGIEPGQQRVQQALSAIRLALEEPVDQPGERESQHHDGGRRPHKGKNLQWKFHGLARVSLPDLRARITASRLCHKRSAGAGVLRESLRGAVPMLLLRGENSAILSSDCVARMRAGKPDMHYREIPRRGHAPTLNEPAARAAIDAFLRQPEITGETTV